MSEIASKPGRAAWLKAVVREYESPLVRYANRLLGDTERARDVVQDTFLRLCQQDCERIAPHVRCWLYTVCRNRALDVRRKESRMSFDENRTTDRLPAGDADQAAVVERQETVGQATAVLATLPQNQQEVIRLRMQSGLSYREIADVMGLSQSHVGVLIHKAVQQLRVQLGASRSRS